MGQGGWQAAGKRLAIKDVLDTAALEGLVLFLVLDWLARRTPPRGLLTGVFLAGYAVARGAVEFVRLPDAHIGYLAGGWLTMGHLLSAPMLLAGLWLVARALRR